MRFSFKNACSCGSVTEGGKLRPGSHVWPDELRNPARRASQSHRGPTLVMSVLHTWTNPQAEIHKTIPTAVSK